MKRSILSSVFLMSFICLSLTVFAQKNYNTYAKRSGPSAAPWNISVNGGVFFPELLGKENAIYGSKDYNPAFGISIGRQLFSNIGLRADLSSGKLSANNFDTPPATSDQIPAFYRDYTTDVRMSASLNLVLSIPILRIGQYRNRPITFNAWGGAGVINFETQFNVNPDRNVYYGEVTDVYTTAGAALKYRVGKRVDLGANYSANFFNGYNLDAVQVTGPNKDTYSFAYISLNILIGEMADWRYGRSRSCYSF